MRDTAEILLLILVANAAPVLASYFFSHKASWPIDSDYRLTDGLEIFGADKTWRGLFASVFVTIVVAWLIGSTAIVGLVISLCAMAGDLISSFIKRRVGMEPSSRATLLDQIPESLLPALASAWFWSIGLIHIIAIVTSFLILEIILSKIFFNLGVRKRPH